MIRRTQLYVPAISEKMIRKSVELNADSIIFDLEDAVPPEEKDTARKLLSKALKELDWGKKELCVRINPLQSPESFSDLLVLSREDKIDCLVVPKAENDLSFLYKATGKRIFPLIETAKGLTKIEDIIRSEGVDGVSYGIADLALSLGGDYKFYEGNLYIKTLIVSVARTYDVDPVDKVFFDLKDMEGFKRECEEAKRLGYVGKQVIHPSQISIANEVFSPSREEVEWASRVIEAYEKARKEGKGAIRLDDKLIDYVHYKLAKRIMEFGGE
ncbi:HpcH/HpaI aldolase/citrate lyase family protein [Stygiolobus azoricus]|uniref:CoA ester lyase n=1 Tax=Stygiolobus azoricus TaxID=41675 RepID=A0A650CQ03_9CREN|nr:CoA ester lyase [Stygiolobus azoricus]QGR19732.1 CoA ester lyase [Stygiolobus azoricus]